MDYYPGQLFYSASDFPTPTYETSPGLQGSTDAQGNVLAFTIPDEQRLMRFLVLGSESGTFYATESALTEQNATCVTNLINSCLLYTSPSPRDMTISRMPSSA